MRHDSIVMEFTLPEKFVVDREYIKIHTLKMQEQVYLILQSRYQAIYYKMRMHFTL